MRSGHIIAIAIFATLLLTLAVVVVTSLRRTARAGRRLQAVSRVGQGRCPQCNYDVAGRLADACIECGHIFTASERRRLEGMYAALSRMRDRGTR